MSQSCDSQASQNTSKFSFAILLDGWRASVWAAEMIWKTDIRYHTVLQATEFGQKHSEKYNYSVVFNSQLPFGQTSITFGKHTVISLASTRTTTLLIGWPLNPGAESLLLCHAGPDISFAGQEHSTLWDNYWHGWFPRANIIRSGIGGLCGQRVLSHLKWMAGVWR